MKIICSKHDNHWVASVDDTTTEDIEFFGLKAGHVWDILRRQFPGSRIGFTAADLGPRTEELCPDGILWMR